jgi:DNA repair protein RecO (recombination protein O)
MEWTDDAFVLGLRRHGETSVILEAMTRDHGRHLGLVRGGRSREKRPVLQAGNAVRLVWRGRIEEHLGNFEVEAVKLHAGRILSSKLALFALTHVTALARLLPERDPHPAVHSALENLLESIGDVEFAPAMVARFELEMLAELGFGLDLSVCAVTGGDADLAYVSPRSGRAVSRTAGAPYADRLLPLPLFLRESGAAPTEAEVIDAYRLTGYFLQRDVLGPRGVEMPQGRQALIDACKP